MQTATDPKNALRLRQLLIAMVLVLTFEGIARKAVPAFGIPLFFLKDTITIAMGYYVMRMPLNPIIQTLFTGYQVLIFLMIPSIIMTAIHDPKLAIFGAKQYLLFPIAGFATFMAFENSKWATILSFYRWMGLLLIPTMIMAVVQIKLPHSSWLNESVNGDDLGNFSSGGILRVSSTFSFVAQYCSFLNVETFVLIVALHGWNQQTFRWKVLTLSLIPVIVVSSFITGSRSAVVGNLSIILLALVYAMFKLRMRSVLQVLFVMLLLYIGVLALNHFFPTATAVYSEREKGQLIGFSAEIRDRVLGSYFSGRDNSLSTFLGNGLGIMSNGSDLLSHYAAVWRARLWTESDFSTTLFEGGFYLAFVWYGFRLFVIFVAFRHFISDITDDFSVCMSFCQAYVTVEGLMATLSLQPPYAIWWWFSVGTMMLFCRKCSGPPEGEEPNEEPPPPPMRKIRGRSLYADVIHTPSPR